MNIDEVINAINANSFSSLNLNDVAAYVEENIGGFHSKKVSSLSELTLKDVLIGNSSLILKVQIFLTL